jgi:leucine dehydrogenase
VLDATIERWNGEAVVSHYDAEARAWMFIAIHDTTLGNAAGGTRTRAYRDPAEGLEDAMRLAEGMTAKWAILDIPYGGGKCVIAPERPVQGEARERLFQRYGSLLETLNGAFQTGVDLGTTPRDMANVAQMTRHVHGVNFDDGSTRDPGPFTARGVVRAIEAALEVVFSDPDPAGRSILVQGVGDVGAPLARQLAAAGAELLISDVDRERAAAVAAEVGGRLVEPDDAAATPCDVFAPCAVGGILDTVLVERLQCRIVAGSANAQLAAPEIADRLQERGILYAPDFVANGGGAAAFGLIALGEKDEALVRKVDAIGDTLRGIFREAAAGEESPLAAARRIVEQRMAARRSG